MLFYPRKQHAYQFKITPDCVNCHAFGVPATNCSYSPFIMPRTSYFLILLVIPDIMSLAKKVLSRERSDRKVITMIIIVDYNAGNLTSVKRALDYLSIPSEITPDPGKIRSAEKIIFPGVGHATSAMQTLRQRGLDAALHEAFSGGTPILGICLGTQVILSSSEETDLPCLDLIKGTNPRFVLSDPGLKIPHMGWDSIKIRKSHPVLSDIKVNDEFYFVHSFYPQPENENDIYAVGEYEIVFPVVIGRNNLIATQFHPEKSGPVGLQLLINFSSWDGSPC